MLPLTSKTCTKFSKIFLVCSVLPIVLLVMDIYGIGMLYKLFTATKNVAFVYYPSCLLSGLSLIFSTGARSNSLKGWSVFVHFITVYSFVVILIPLFGGMILVASTLTYLLLPIMSQRLPRKKTQQRVQVILLGLPMIYSTVYFIIINYYLITLDGEIIKYLILMSLSGLIGLILSTGLDNGRAKWFLLGINYVFATYFHIDIWILGL
ncbi:MAG: hypothetical protein IC227_09730 [Enterococcus lacertideformus]|uniref:Uncharacterized protein n=1 Tax=Enterococcus lacertideformus TaxID=2771493 RepID=A0A931FD57_9ENTE|nr:hypothetical protein [Enterococcus lacertideformus]